MNFIKRIICSLFDLVDEDQYEDLDKKYQTNLKELEAAN